MFFYDLTTSQPTKRADFHGGGEYGYSVLYHLLDSFKFQGDFYVIYNYHKEISSELYKKIKTMGIKTIHADSPEMVLNLVNEEKPLVFYTPLINACYSKMNESVELWVTIHGVRVQSIVPKILNDELARDFFNYNTLKSFLYFKFLQKSKIIRNFLIRKSISRDSIVVE
jgi:hypothetical protein